MSNIDAPEIEGQCRYESNLAQVSKNRLAALLDCQRVEIPREGEDRYRRTLATLRVKGRDVGDQLVSEGLARIPNSSKCESEPKLDAYHPARGVNIPRRNTQPFHAASRQLQRGNQTRAAL
ncbi:thermonuclease family protein [Neorhizobium sp. BT27B]|uniref:thermonuclease family protein n=1 Tax=Neorhizobium sp. BT27B TaxID=3142625 RepID=UPI003D2DE699